MSQRLGHLSNVVYRWETGLRHPTLSQFFRLAGCAGRSARKCVVQFDPHLKALVQGNRPLEKLSHQLLVALTEGQTVTVVARRTGLSRHAVSRMLHGHSEPRLPDVLRVVQAATGRMVDWVAAFVSPEKLPSLASAWSELQARRTLAYRHPLSELLTAALETADYQLRGGHDSQWLATRLELSQQSVESTLHAMIGAGVLQRSEDRWHVSPHRRVDTDVDKVAVHALKMFWTAEALRRMERFGQTKAAYSVMSISEEALQAATNVLLEAYREVRRLCAGSQRTERVALLNIQLSVLDGKGFAE